MIICDSRVIFSNTLAHSVVSKPCGVCACVITFSKLIQLKLNQHASVDQCRIYLAEVAVAKAGGEISDDMVLECMKSQIHNAKLMGINVANNLKIKEKYIDKKIGEAIELFDPLPVPQTIIDTIKGLIDRR